MIRSNVCIWGGNERLRSLNRGERVLFSVSLRRAPPARQIPQPGQYLLQSPRGLRNLSREVSLRIDRAVTDTSTSARVICAHDRRSSSRPFVV